MCAYYARSVVTLWVLGARESADDRPEKNLETKGAQGTVADRPIARKKKCSCAADIDNNNNSNTKPSTSLISCANNNVVAREEKKSNNINSEACECASDETRAMFPRPGQQLR